MAPLIPWKRSEIVALRRHIDLVCDRFFSDLSDRFCRSELIYDWHFAEAEDHFLLVVEIPERSPEDLDVTATADTVTIAVAGDTAVLGGGGAGLRRCRAVREVRLPAPIDADRVEAVYRNGVLKVVLPKAARSPHSIPVRSAAAKA